MNKRGNISMAHNYIINKKQIKIKYSYLSQRNFCYIFICFDTCVAIVYFLNYLTRYLESINHLNG